MAVLATVLAAGALSGCQLFGGPAGQSVAPTPTASETATTAAAAPAVLVPGGTAEQNKPFFDSVNQATLGADGKASSRALVDALVAAGFDKAAMEVTYDKTSIDLDADYVIVSVNLSGTCLIGQRSSSGYVSEIAAEIPTTHKCLIGGTQPIDW